MRLKIQKNLHFYYKFRINNFCTLKHTSQLITSPTTFDSNTTLLSIHNNISLLTTV